MPLYAKPSKELVIDLINEANPQLPFPLTKDTVSVALPVKLPDTPGKIQNASVDVVPRAPSGYTNKMTLQYRRINLASLFRGVEVRVDVYTSRGTGIAPIRLSDILSALNKKYGLSLAYEDIQDAWFPTANANAVPGKRSSRQVLRMHPQSYAYVGEVTVLWVQGLQNVADMVKQTSLDGRLYPGGNVFDETHKYVANLDTFSLDMTEHSAAMNALQAGSVIGSGNTTVLANQQAVIDLINQLTGKTFLRDVAGEYGLATCTVQRYTLPAVAVPEANASFNRLVTFTFPTAHPWGVGKLYLHYNV